MNAVRYAPTKAMRIGVNVGVGLKRVMLCTPLLTSHALG